MEAQGTIATGISSTVLPTLLENYRTYGVEQYTGHTVTRIGEGELVCQDPNGHAVHIACDHVVMAIGARSVAFDTEALSAKGIAVIKVGDCSEVADIAHAITTGYDAANAI